jgi:hypothetical protein
MGKWTLVLGLRLAAIGQLLPFDDSGEQPSERPLYFETCRKVNSHFSALADVRLPISVGQQCIGYLPLTRGSR